MGKGRGRRQVSTKPSLIGSSSRGGAHALRTSARADRRHLRCYRMSRRPRQRRPRAHSPPMAPMPFFFARASKPFIDAAAGALPAAATREHFVEDLHGVVAPLGTRKIASVSPFRIRRADLALGLIAEGGHRLVDDLARVISARRGRRYRLWNWRSRPARRAGPSCLRASVHRAPSRSCLRRQTTFVPTTTLG